MLCGAALAAMLTVKFGIPFAAKADSYKGFAVIHI
jgi:hypothetical protein